MVASCPQPPRPPRNPPPYTQVKRPSQHSPPKGRDPTWLEACPGSRVKRQSSRAAGAGSGWEVDQLDKHHPGPVQATQWPVCLTLPQRPQPWLGIPGVAAVPGTQWLIADLQATLLPSWEAAAAWLAGPAVGVGDRKSLTLAPGFPGANAVPGMIQAAPRLGRILIKPWAVEGMDLHAHRPVDTPTCAFLGPG